MDAAALGRRFSETTRGQIVTLLRRGTRTVEELAQALGLTDNAIRNHLAALERDGLVRAEGVRRTPGAGKPATLYELHPDAAPLLSRAYPPVLGAVIGVLVDELPAERTTEMLRETGRRLGRRAGGRASGDLDARVRAAASALEALGGDVDVLAAAKSYQIKGSGCPLSSVTCQRPEACEAVAGLVAEIAGATTKVRCEHGPKPRCCFEISSAA